MKRVPLILAAFQVGKTDQSGYNARQSRLDRRHSQRLGRGSIDYIPNIDIHFVEDNFKLARQCDINGTKDVLGEFGGLSDSAGTNGVHSVQSL